MRAWGSGRRIVDRGYRVIFDIMERSATLPTRPTLLGTATATDQTEQQESAQSGQILEAAHLKSDSNRRNRFDNRAVNDRG
jgi:hypothetical protein